MSHYDAQEVPRVLCQRVLSLSIRCMQYVFLITNFVQATGRDRLMHKHRWAILTKVSDGLSLYDMNINVVSLAHPKIHSFHEFVYAASLHCLSP